MLQSNNTHYVVPHHLNFNNSGYQSLSGAEVHTFRFLPVAVELGLYLFQSNLTSPKCIFRLALVTQVVAQPALKAAHAHIKDGTPA
jgi:hypothetical protein